MLSACQLFLVNLQPHTTEQESHSTISVSTHCHLYITELARHISNCHHVGNDKTGTRHRDRCTPNKGGLKTRMY